MPYFRRGDVTREADLVEEVARLWGLEKLPATLPSRRGATGVLAPEQRLRRRAEDALAGAGLYEALGWTFASPELVERLRIPADDPRHAAVVLRNPMSEDQSVLRTTMLGSLLDVAKRNRARGMADVRLFEIGAIFLAQPRAGEPTAAERRVRAAARGAPAPRRAADRRDAAAVVARRRAAAGRLLRRQGRARRRCSTRCACRGASSAPREPFLHPGRSARVLVGGERRRAGSARSTRRSRARGTSRAAPPASSSTSR